MSEHEFRQLVASMRSHQKAYFATRSEEELRLSQQAERRVDKDNDEYFNPGLFG